MTGIETAEQIRIQCTLLENDGYRFHHESQLVWYEKTEATRRFTISFNYLRYNYMDVYGLRASVRFDEIENAVQRNEKDTKKSSDTIHIFLNADNLNYAINREELPTTDNYHFEISNIEGAAAYAKLINAFYSETVLPFFETYTTLAAINQWIATQPGDNHKTLISSEGNAMVLRRIMIMYYAGDGGYEDLLNRYKAHLEAKKDESPFGLMYLNLLAMEEVIYTLGNKK